MANYSLNKSIPVLCELINVPGIYCIRNVQNHKCYVGSSKNIANRLRYHISTLKNNNHANQLLQNDWNKYGQDYFEIEVLEEVSGTHSNRLKIEAKWILKLKGYPYGYNLSVSTHGYRRRKSGNEYYPKYHPSELTPEIATKCFNNGQSINKVAQNYGCKIDDVMDKIIEYMNLHNIDRLYGGG